MCLIYCFCVYRFLPKVFYCRNCKRDYTRHPNNIQRNTKKADVLLLYPNISNNGENDRRACCTENNIQNDCALKNMTLKSLYTRTSAEARDEQERGVRVQEMFRR